MPFWQKMYFMDSNSPIMEQLIMFHDHSMIMITSIMMFLMMMMAHLIILKKMNLNLNENQLIEIIWTISPVALLLFMAIPSLRLLYLMEEMFSSLLTIKIIGHQWYWNYEYSDFNLNFDSFMKQLQNKNSLFRLMDVTKSPMIPMNCSIRLLVTSADVIHSWTIPSLGVKTDAIPGRLNQINLLALRPGVFYGQCSEICGANHSFMPINMKICSVKNFKKWSKTMD